VIAVRGLLAIVAAWLIAATATSAPAQELLSEEMQAQVAALQEKVDGFFTQLSNKTIGPERAVREIIGSGPLKERNEEIAKLIEQTLTLDQRYGAYTGHESVAARAVGTDLVFLRYLYKGERFPIIWYFAFYRTATAGGLKRDWSLISLRFDSKIETLDR
jgi:hypothetical protein